MVSTRKHLTTSKMQMSTPSQPQWTTCSSQARLWTINELLPNFMKWMGISLDILTLYQQLAHTNITTDSKNEILSTIQQLKHRKLVCFLWVIRLERSSSCYGGCAERSAWHDGLTAIWVATEVWRCIAAEIRAIVWRCVAEVWRRISSEVRRTVRAEVWAIVWRSVSESVVWEDHFVKVF